MIIKDSSPLPPLFLGIHLPVASFSTLFAFELLMDAAVPCRLGLEKHEEEERLERERTRMKWEELRWDLRRSREAMERMVMGREEERMEIERKRLDEERRIMEREDRWGELEEMERRLMRKEEERERG